MAARIEMVHMRKGKPTEIVPLNERFHFIPRPLTNRIKSKRGKFYSIRCDDASALSLMHYLTYIDTFKKNILSRNIEGVYKPVILEKDEINEAHVKIPRGFRRYSIFRYVPEEKAA